MSKRLPAEWEDQDAVMLTWPHVRSDWAQNLGRIVQLYRQLTFILLDLVQVIIAAAPEDVEAIAASLRHHPRAKENLHVYAVASNDTWARDHGPLTVFENGHPHLLDFTFDGWGGKFDSAVDNQISLALHEQGAFGDTPLTNVDMVLEGGAIEVDGKGTLLATRPSVLGRRGNEDQALVEKKLQQYFGIKRFHWLNHGYLAGDDTDSHIDTLARFCPNNTICYVQCSNEEDEHFSELQAMEAELQTLKNGNGQPYRLIPLPWPSAKYHSRGHRLPATYANFLITNGAVLVPQYDDDKDAQALKAVAKAFPDRKVIGLPCLPLIEQHGSLHCITMQIPTGVLRL